MIGLYPVGSRAVGGAESVARVRPDLGVADSSFTGVGFDIALTMGKAEAEYNANPIVDLTSVILQTAGATVDANGIIPLHKPNLIFADAIFASPNIDGLQIRLKVERADASMNALDIQALTRLELGQATATVNANDVIPTHKPDLVIATASAEALDLDGLTIRLDVGQATATANALDSSLNILLDMGIAEMTGNANDLDGLSVGLNLGTADATADALGMNLGLGLGTANALYNGLGIVPKTILDLTTATATFSAVLQTLLVGLKLGRADASFNALDLADIVYVVDELPEIQVDRQSTQATVKVTNPSNTFDSRIFRADDHRANFDVLVSSHDESSDYVDSGLDASINYKYKVAFIAEGTKGGVEYIVVGERSAPVYTIGNKVL